MLNHILYTLPYITYILTGKSISQHSINSIRLIIQEPMNNSVSLRIVIKSVSQSGPTARSYGSRPQEVTVGEHAVVTPGHSVFHTVYVLSNFLKQKFMLTVVLISKCSVEVQVSDAPTEQTSTPSGPRIQFYEFH